MKWNPLTDDTQLQELIRKSFARPQAIFKHSTRCSISSMAKNRLERDFEPDNVDFYFLDLIAYRALSQQVANTFSIAHESPQLLLIKNGTCVYHESHSGISMDEITEHSAAS